MNLHRFAVRAAGMTAMAAALVVLSACSTSDASPMPATPVAAAPQANFSNTTAILVHGAWADGSSWSRVTPLLQAQGMNVVSVQLHLSSLAEDVATVRRVLAAQTGKVVLVGHSYGGVVITEAGTDPKVGALVYLAAFAPDEGQSVFDMISPFPPAPWQAGLVQDSAGYTTLTPAAYQTYFASDLPKDQAAVLATAQGPTNQQALADKLTHASWKTKPSYWAISASDQIVPPAFQQQEAAHINAKVTMIDGGGHTGMLSHPQEVAGVIVQAAAGIK
jgi:pimeloyl-ACP methyl ester carboxylesterase